MKMSFLKELLQLHICDELRRAREQALKDGIPVAEEETLQYLLYTVRSLKPKRILEIGTAVGISGTAMLLEAKDARLTTIEIDEPSYFRAKETFTFFGVKDRVIAHLGGAGDILPAIPCEKEGLYDLIFLDGPKAQYLSYLPDLKRLLRTGGVLFSDDVLLYGWVEGEAPKKRHVLVEKIREYLRALCGDSDFLTSVLPIGDGVAVSALLKKTEENIEV